MTKEAIIAKTDIVEIITLATFTLFYRNFLGNLEVHRKRYAGFIVERRFWIDGANRAFVNLMKVAFKEPLSWETRKQGPNPEVWKVLPVDFATEHKQMLAHLHMLINKEYLVIPEQFYKLITSLRTAYAKEYALDKEQTSYSDSIDALRLACKMYKMN